ncbi:MAG TPA: AI-2E family transporter [Polyangiaceae bacterium]|nr:AI-2E family transporter [Polyangiaceae bacterium]
MDLLDADLQPESGWTRGGIIFLAISAAFVIALCVAVREVLLPFVLGLTIAYVLMPAVTWTERKARVPRAPAILMVYAVVVGSLGLTMWLGGPRVYHETVRIARDIPRLTHDLAERHGPQLEAWVRAYRGGRPEPSADEQLPALSIESRPDGSQQIRVRSGLNIVEEAPGHYHVAPRHEGADKEFDVSTLVDDGLDRLLRYVELNALVVLQLGHTIVSSVVRTIFIGFMVLMVGGYIMYTRESVLAFFRSLSPPRYRPEFGHLLARIDRGLAGVVRGQLLICVVNGVLSAIGFWIFGLKYWPILALFAAAFSIVPIFGAILSSVPAVLVGLTQDPFTALWVLVWIIGIHQLEANLLNPRIIGVSAKIHPVLVVFSLLVGEHYYGLWGALFAVPTLSILQSVFNHFRFLTLEDAGPDSMGVRELLRSARS